MTGKNKVPTPIGRMILVRRYKVDVADAKAIADVVHVIENEWGSISSVVNLFGIHQVCEFENIFDEAWDAMSDIHVNGTVNVCRAIIPYVQRREHGAIVIMSSSHLSPRARAWQRTTFRRNT